MNISLTKPKSVAYVGIVVALCIAALAMAGLLYWYAQQNPHSQDHEPGLTNDERMPIKKTFVDEAEVPRLTVEELLDGRPLPDNLDPAKIRTIVVTGDIIPARGVDYQIRRQGFDFPFADSRVIEILQGGDLAISSLEAPLIRACPEHMTGFVFCGQAPFAEVMAKAGIDAMSLENNHIGNYGLAGIEETKQVLEAVKIEWFDSQQLKVMDIKGLKIGLLSFNGITYRPILDQDAVATVRQAAQEVDLLIVATHWGKEYQLTPMADAGIAPEHPMEVAKQLVEAGADMIIGNHPHWVQGLELYNNSLIGYAYGNFIFDQSWSTETMQSYIATYTYYGTTLIKADFKPIMVHQQAQPRLVEGAEAEAILNRVRQSSLEIAGLRKIGL